MGLSQHRSSVADIKPAAKKALFLLKSFFQTLYRVALHPSTLIPPSASSPAPISGEHTHYLAFRWRGSTKAVWGHLRITLPICRPHPLHPPPTTFETVGNSSCIWQKIVSPSCLGQGDYMSQVIWHQLSEAEQGWLQTPTSLSTSGILQLTEEVPTGNYQVQ